MSVRVCCDFCNRPLEIVDGRYKFYRIKEPNIRALYPCLCENCNKKLQDIFDIFVDTVNQKADILLCNRELNQARRERLGTKG